MQGMIREGVVQFVRKFSKEESLFKQLGLTLNSEGKVQTLENSEAISQEEQDLKDAKEIIANASLGMADPTSQANMEKNMWKILEASRATKHS
jgi:hypothetical protein